MKTKFSSVCAIPVAFTMAIALLFSCSHEESLQSDGVVNTKYVPSPVELPTNSLQWDVSYHPDSQDTRASANHSHEMAVTNSNIFIGGVYTANSIEDLTYLPISNPVEGIDVSYTFPRYYFDFIERPSNMGMYRSLNKAVDSPSFTGKQSLSFEYDFKQFYHYNELKLAFGANVNICSLFKLDASVSSQKVNSKSGLFARVVQKNFALIMDYPYDGNIFKNNSDLSANLSVEPVYVNSIIFGRMAIIAIESEYSYNELKAAFNASLSAKVVQGELNISAEHKKILQESHTKIFVSGGAGQAVAEIVVGFDKFTEFILNGGEFTRDVPGVPIFFTANYARDNSVFSTTFTTEE